MSAIAHHRRTVLIRRARNLLRASHMALEAGGLYVTKKLLRRARTAVVRAERSVLVHPRERR